MNHQLLRARGADLLKANDLSEQSVESRLFIADLSVGDGPAAATGVLWGLSYFFWRRLQGHAGERLTAHRRLSRS